MTDDASWPQRDRRLPDPWRDDVNRRLAAQEKLTAEILGIVKRLDRDHYLEEAVRKTRADVRAEWRQRAGDVGRVVTFLGIVVTLALGIMALVGGG